MGINTELIRATIRQLRKERNISQDALSGLAGIVHTPDHDRKRHKSSIPLVTFSS